MPEALGLLVAQGVGQGQGFGLFGAFVDETRGGGLFLQGFTSRVILGDKGAQEPEVGGFSQGLVIVVFEGA